MSKIEYRKFLIKQSHTTTQIKDRMTVAYGDFYPSYATMKSWSKLFRWGTESLEENPCEGGAIKMITRENRRNCSTNLAFRVRHKN